MNYSGNNSLLRLLTLLKEKLTSYYTKNESDAKFALKTNILSKEEIETDIKAWAETEILGGAD